MKALLMKYKIESVFILANNQYSYETKLEVIRLLNEGVSGRKICEKLGLKLELFHSSLKSEMFYHQLEPVGSKDIKIKTMRNYILTIAFSQTNVEIGATNTSIQIKIGVLHYP